MTKLNCKNVTEYTHLFTPVKRSYVSTRKVRSQCLPKLWIWFNLQSCLLPLQDQNLRATYWAQVSLDTQHKPSQFPYDITLSLLLLWMATSTLRKMQSQHKTSDSTQHFALGRFRIWPPWEAESGVSTLHRVPCWWPGVHPGVQQIKISRKAGLSRRGNDLPLPPQVHWVNEGSGKRECLVLRGTAIHNLKDKHPATRLSN